MMKFLTFIVIIVATASAMSSRSGNYFRRVSSFVAGCQGTTTTSDCTRSKNTADAQQQQQQFLGASANGNTLIYTTPLAHTAAAAAAAIGFVDITDPTNPIEQGTFPLNASSPSSIATLGDSALIPVDSSRLIVIDIPSRTLLRNINLGGGRPSDVAVSPNGNYAVVIIENGNAGGTITDNDEITTTAGHVIVIDILTNTTSWTTTTVPLTGLDHVRFPTNPNPKSVSINTDNIAAVTLQSNNAIVLIHLESKTIQNVIPAGIETLWNVDLTPDGVITQNEIAYNLLHEPHGITWLSSSSNNYFATANQGNINGGSRGITIYDNGGNLHYTSASTMEHLMARVGHCPELNSKRRGNEPTFVTYGKFGDDDELLFVISDGSSTVTIFDVNPPSMPIQVLPSSGIGPQGSLALPSRNLFVVGSRTSVISIYEYGYPSPTYPTIVSNNVRDETYIPWGAISGIAANIRGGSDSISSGGAGNGDRRKKKGAAIAHTDDIMLYAVEDRFYRKTRILTIDVTATPAVVVKEIRITDQLNWLKTAPMAFEAGLINVEDNTVNLDAEGIAVSKEGGFWVCSEGKGTVDSNDFPVEFLNYLVKVDDDGDIVFLVTLPEEVNAIQSGFGFEGCAEGSDAFGDVVVVAFQRAWGDEAHPRLGAYNMATAEWTFYYYPLDEPPSSANEGGEWVGVSEIAPLGVGGEFLVLERDNQSDDAAIKRIYKIDLGMQHPGDVVVKTFVRNVVPDILKQGGLLVEKVDGLTVDQYGDVWIVNDNDGLDGTNGETLLLKVMSSAFEAQF